MRKSKIAASVISLFALLLSGCFYIEPTYTKEKIVESITTLCEKEYKVKPEVWLLGETVWVYIPLPRLITKTAQLDNETMNKITKVVMGASRVLLSMRPRPQFMVLIASDTEEYGIDYTVITWIPDIVKYQLQFISRDEFTRRNVIRIKENPLAISDTKGSHIEKNEIKLEDFLAWQIAQRVYSKFILDAKLKDYFKVESINSVFNRDAFKIYVDIKQIKKAPQALDLQKEIATIAAYVIKEYDFKNFVFVEIENSLSGEKSVFNRVALRDFLK